MIFVVFIAICLSIGSGINAQSSHFVTSGQNVHKESFRETMNAASREHKDSSFRPMLVVESLDQNGFMLPQVLD